MGSKSQSGPRAQRTRSHLLPGPAAQPSSLPLILCQPRKSAFSALSSPRIGSSQRVKKCGIPFGNALRGPVTPFRGGIWVFAFCICHMSALLHTCLFILCEGPRPIAQPLQEPPECRTAPRGLLQSSTRACSSQECQTSFQGAAVTLEPGP